MNHLKCAHNTFLIISTKKKTPKNAFAKMHMLSIAPFQSKPQLVIFDWLWLVNIFNVDWFRTQHRRIRLPQIQRERDSICVNLRFYFNCMNQKRSFIKLVPALRNRLQSNQLPNARTHTHTANESEWEKMKEDAMIGLLIWRHFKLEFVQFLNEKNKILN